MTTPDGHERRWLWGLAAVWLLSLPLLGIAPLFPAELPAAEAARELLASGTYAWPLHAYYPDPAQPPLLPWLQALSMALLGQNAWAVRLPAVLLSAGLLWAVWSHGRRVWGAAPAATWVLLTGGNLWLGVAGRTGTAGAALLLALLLACSGLGRPGLRTAAWAGLAAGLGVLASGWAALLLPVLAALLHNLALRGRDPAFRWARLAVFAAVSLLPLALWLGWGSWGRGGAHAADWLWVQTAQLFQTDSAFPGWAAAAATALMLAPATALGAAAAATRLQAKLPLLPGFPLLPPLGAAAACWAVFVGQPALASALLLPLGALAAWDLAPQAFASRQRQALLAEGILLALLVLLLTVGGGWAVQQVLARAGVGPQPALWNDGEPALAGLLLVGLALALRRSRSRSVAGVRAWALTLALVATAAGAVLLPRVSEHLAQPEMALYRALRGCGCYVAPPRDGRPGYLWAAQVPPQFSAAGAGIAADRFSAWLQYGPIDAPAVFIVHSRDIRRYRDNPELRILAVAGDWHVLRREPSPNRRPLALGW